MEEKFVVRRSIEELKLLVLPLYHVSVITEIPLYSCKYQSHQSSHARFRTHDNALRGKVDPVSAANCRPVSFVTVCRASLSTLSQSMDIVNAKLTRKRAL